MTEKVVAHDGDIGKFREVAKRGGYDRLADGTWFQKFVAEHIKKHSIEIGAAHWDKLYPNLSVEERADREIKKTMLRASAAGAAASVGASTGELLALVTDGLAAPVGLPAAAVSMVSEAIYTLKLQVDLACDLASIYGVPFDPDDFGEMATLFGLAFEVDVTKKKEETETEEEHKAKSGVTAKLLELEDGEFAKRVGRKLLEESVMRNIIPIVGIGISARWNWVATRKFGVAAKKYARYRRALRGACLKLALKDVADPALLIEGAWLLATIDGDARHEELLALALILEALPIESSDLRLDGEWDDEEDWFERVRQAPKELHTPLLDVLYLVAATDREIEPAEKRFLRRLGKAIGRDIDFARLERFARYLAEGSEIGEDVLHAH